MSLGFALPGFGVSVCEQQFGAKTEKGKLVEFTPSSLSRRELKTDFAESVSINRE